MMRADTEPDQSVLNTGSPDSGREALSMNIAKDTPVDDAPIEALETMIRLELRAE